MPLVEGALPSTSWIAATQWEKSLHRRRGAQTDCSPIHFRTLIFQIRMLGGGSTWRKEKAWVVRVPPSVSSLILLQHTSCPAASVTHLQLSRPRCCLASRRVAALSGTSNIRGPDLGGTVDKVCGVTTADSCLQQECQATENCYPDRQR